jgi:hypothetical protein
VICFFPGAKNRGSVERSIKWIQQQVELSKLLGIDGWKTCAILVPKNSGRLFFNYKGTFSVVSFAVADAN